MTFVSIENKDKKAGDTLPLTERVVSPVVRSVL